MYIIVIKQGRKFEVEGIRKVLLIPEDKGVDKHQQDKVCDRVVGVEQVQEGAEREGHIAPQIHRLEQITTEENPLEERVTVDPTFLKLTPQPVHKVAVIKTIWGQ